MAGAGASLPEAPPEQVAGMAASRGGAVVVAATLGPSAAVVELVEGLGVPLRPGELVKVVAALGDLGFDEVESLLHPCAGDMISAHVLLQAFQDRGLGTRAIGLALRIHGKLGERLNWSEASQREPRMGSSHAPPGSAPDASSTGG